MLYKGWVISSTAVVRDGLECLTRDDKQYEVFRPLFPFPKRVPSEILLIICHDFGMFQLCVSNTGSVCRKQCLLARRGKAGTVDDG